MLTDFWQKAAKEQLSGVIFIGLVFVLSVICLFAQISVPAFNFTLPQVRLGIALLIVDFAFVSVAFVTFRRSRRPIEAVNKPSTELDIFSIPAVQPETPSVRILVSGEGEGMSFWKLDGAGELRAWLDVVNFTSAPVKIDRIIGDITVSNATVAQFSFFKKQTVAANSAARVYVHAEFSPQHIKNIEFQLQHEREPGGGLNLTVYLATEKGELELHPRLNTGNCRFVNFARKPAS